MYIIFGILILILVLFVCLSFWRKKRIIRKVCAMCAEEKCILLNELVRPFGYSYVRAQDIFTSRRNAWQRDFGYRALYDKNAVRLNMVFDCLPVYFDYDGKTWLIELWKGQYGICTGCEIGVYHAESILDERERAAAHFSCAEDDEMPRLSFILWKGQHALARLRAKHWWLTAFLPGAFTPPADLSLYASIALSSPAMARAFYDGLIDTGFAASDITACGRTVSFTFKASHPVCGFFAGLREKLAMCMNRIGCRLYLFITRPFCLTADRVLYLYFYLPSAFRRMLSIRRYKGRHRKRGSV